jgi:hypothetical protein
VVALVATGNWRSAENGTWIYRAIRVFTLSDAVSGG